jgi:hypothetical protein
MTRIVSLMVTLLVLAFVILKLMGGDNGQKGAASAAKVDEDRAKAVEAQVLQQARAQDNALSTAEGRRADEAGQPGSVQAAPQPALQPVLPPPAQPANINP